MNYTENYHLPQWVKEDRIMMEDFNQMCRDMEAGLDSNAQAAAKAQTTADTARTEAAELPYAVGRYVGNGTVQEIVVGFRPSFLTICGLVEGGGDTYGGAEACHISTIGQLAPTHLQFTDRGFIVDVNGPSLPRLNRPDHPYEYIAFR